MPTPLLTMEEIHGYAVRHGYSFDESSEALDLARDPDQIEAIGYDLPRLFATVTDLRTRKATEKAQAERQAQIDAYPTRGRKKYRST